MNVNPGEIQFFRGELFRLRGAEGDTERALAEYEKAARAGSHPPQMYRAMGLLYKKSKRTKDAVKAFQNYLASCTDCSDRKMVLHMIRELER